MKICLNLTYRNPVLPSSKTLGELGRTLWVTKIWPNCALCYSSNFPPCSTVPVYRFIKENRTNAKEEKVGCNLNDNRQTYLLKWYFIIVKLLFHQKVRFSVFRCQRWSTVTRPSPTAASKCLWSSRRFSDSWRNVGWASKGCCAWRPLKRKSTSCAEP